MTNTKKIALKTLIITSFVFAFMLFTAQDALAFEEGKCGQTITENLTMTEDLVGCTGNGVEIMLPDITLDCAGHTISGIGSGYGIEVAYGYNINIKNCNIDSFEYGLHVVIVTNSNFINNILENNTNAGVGIIGGYDNFFDNNVFNNNTHGFYGAASDRNQFTNNEVNNSSSGFYLNTCDANDIWANTFTDNIVHVQDNSVRNNYYIGTNGNHWDDYEDNPGFPSGQYIIDTNNIDMYPNVPAPTITCGDTITESLTMTEDLVDCPGDGIIIGASDITLDCTGYSISGSGTGYGISSESISNITIQNCTIDNFEQGIGINNTMQFLIQDNAIINNTNSGIIGIHFDDSNIIDNTFENNGRGININFSFRNLFDNNIFTNNLNDGFYALVLDESQFINNQFINNQGVGLHFDAGHNNDIWNNTFNNLVNVEDSDGGNATTNNYYIGTSGNHWDDFESNPGYPNYYEVVPGVNDMFPNIDNPDTYCGGLIPCECGDTLYTDHTIDYDLSCNTLAGESAITIGRDLVDLDCDSHSISGIGSGYGILNQYSDSNISNCNIDNFTVGIYLDGRDGVSTGHTIENNSISNNTVGVNTYAGLVSLNLAFAPEGYKILAMDGSEKQILLSEILQQNKLMSLTSAGSAGFNTFYNNTIFNNTLNGISSYGPNNIFESNILYNNDQSAIYSGGSNNEAINNNLNNNHFGFYASGDYGTYTSNELYSNDVGIINTANYGTYTSNELYSNDVGIQSATDNNNFTLNNFYDHTNASVIFLDSTNNNAIWDNTFTNNIINAVNYGIDNLFNSTTTGNFWDDLETNPGFPNGEYIIPANGIDYYPITYTVDVDGDGYFFNSLQSLEDEDCNDNDPNVNPGMPEIMNRIDDNCNGRVDEHSKPRIIYMMEALPIVDGRFFR